MGEINKFKLGNKEYQVVPREVLYKRKLYTAEEICKNKTIQEELVALAKKGTHGERDEADFNDNGVLKIIYSGKPKEEDSTPPKE